MRLVGSAQANLFASVSAGINALFGPLHGGANQAVLEMLERIQADGGDVEAFVGKVKDKEAGVRLMGFGHRVYKNYDPRAAIIKKAADEVLAKLGKDDPLLDIANAPRGDRARRRLLRRAQALPERRLLHRPHLQGDGLPDRMFTVLFALGRLPGWIAQWREMMSDPETKIGRPRQIYTGAAQRDYAGQPDPSAARASTGPRPRVGGLRCASSSTKRSGARAPEAEDRSARNTRGMTAGLTDSAKDETVTVVAGGVRPTTFRPRGRTGPTCVRRR